MNKILSYDLENFIVRVQPGVLLDSLAQDCLSHNVMYPPDPGEKFATIGGNVAVNAGGMRAVKYGATRDYVRAMTVVLPCGEIVRLGAETSKASAGYSLLNLMIGSEGTLGVITELSLKVIAKPKLTLSLLAMFPDLDTCISSVPPIMMAGLDPQALEFLPREVVDGIHKFLGRTVFPGKCDGMEAGAYLLSSFDCRSENDLDLIMESAAETFLENGAMDVIVYDTPEAMRSAWAVRSSTLESFIAAYELMDETDIVVPIPKIAEYVNYVTGLEDEIGLKILASGHAGDGNVHCNVLASGMDKDEFIKKASRFMELAYAKGKELGGQVSGEHGIGVSKISYLEQFAGPSVIRLMRDIKKAFDPKMLLNPGKVF